jgi:UDP:flavonoid glycosyltransferase YjiC (YdhE family)
MIKTSKTFLFLIPSSHGFLFPAMKIAIGLQGKGHNVHFIISDEYSELLDSYNLVHTSLKPEHSNFLKVDKWFDTKSILEGIELYTPIVKQIKPDVIISYPLVISSYIISEMNKLKLCLIGFAELLFGSKHAYTFEKSRVLGLLEIHNKVRKKLSLSQLSELKIMDYLFGDIYFSRNIRALDPVSKSYNNKVHYCGSLFWEPKCSVEPMINFLSNSRPDQKTLYVNVGRLFGDNKLIQSILSVLSQSDFRALINVGRADYHLKNVQKNLFVSEFIPLGVISEFIDAIITTSNSATLLGGIANGCPMILLPSKSECIVLPKTLHQKKIGIYLEDNNLSELDIFQFLNKISQDKIYKKNTENLKEKMEIQEQKNSPESILIQMVSK